MSLKGLFEVKVPVRERPTSCRWWGPKEWLHGSADLNRVELDQTMDNKPINKSRLL